MPILFKKVVEIQFYKPLLLRLLYKTMSPSKNRCHLKFYFLWFIVFFSVMLNFVVRFSTFSRFSSTKTMSSDKCLFCNIISGTSPASICYQDDELLAFHDIKPVSKHHFLVVPKQHFDSVNTLTASNISLVDRMVDCGKKVLTELGADLNDTRFGFHCPPFNSIKHLHLHCISPTSDMGFLHNLMFRPNTWWFSTVDQTLENLKSKI